MTQGFQHRKLELFKPTFDSRVQDAILELEHLRRVSLQGSTPASVFFQLKALFHKLESLGSARIEGNRTTLAEYIAVADSHARPGKNEQIEEIGNIERALAFIDENIKQGDHISGSFIRELQQIVVKDLIAEGDKGAGAYREHNVIISGASHVPPDAYLVPGLMNELIDFINKDDPHKYDLIKVAQAHHRFGWIHPFGNGNGRTVRLLTYAMLIKYGFNVGTAGRILNPTAVFCCDRDKYYEMLSLADEATPENTDRWCAYVLEGILEEFKKLEIFTKYQQVKDKILLPAIRSAHNKGLIGKEDLAILELSVEKLEISAKDVAVALGIESSQATYRLGKLRKESLIAPVAEGKRSYALCFSSSKLVYGIIEALDKNCLIPQTLIKG